MSRLRPYLLPVAYGGLNAKIAKNLVPDEGLTFCDNFVVRGAGLTKAKGWEKFTSQQLTDGAAPPAALSILRIDQYFKNDGNSYLVVLCDQGAYFFRESVGLWIPLTEHTLAETTVDQNSASGAPTLYVASTTGYAAGDHIAIDPDGDGDGAEDAVVSSVTAGDHLTLKSNLTITHLAATADDVKRYYYAAIVDSDSASGQKVLNVDYTDRFTAGEAVLIGWNTGREEYGVIDTIQAGVSITLVGNLGFTHTAVQADKVTRVNELLTTTATDWDSDLSGDTFYATNFVDRVKSWDASGDPSQWSDLAGLDECEGLTSGHVSKAKYLKVFEGFLLLGHMNENGTTIPQKIRWSRYGDYTLWANNVDGTGQAGYFLFDGPDWIVGLYQLKREMTIYRERSLEGMSYVGPPDIFQFRRAQTGIGLLAHNALVDLGDAHIFVGPDNIYLYDGITAQPIGDPIKSLFFNTLDPSKKSQVNAFYIEEEDEVWIAYAEAGSDTNNKAFVYNVSLNVWSGPRDVDSIGFGYYERQASKTIDELTGTIDEQDYAIDSRRSLANNPLNLMGNGSGYVFLLDEIYTADGDTMTGKFRTKVTDCGMPYVVKRLQRIRLALSEVGTSQEYSVAVGVMTNAGDEPKWYGSYPVSVDTNGEPWVYVDLTARYFIIEVSTTAPGGYVYEVELWTIPRSYKGVVTV